MYGKILLSACPQISLHPGILGTFSGRIQGPFLLLLTYLILFVNIHIKPPCSCSKIQFKFYPYAKSGFCLGCLNKSIFNFTVFFCYVSVILPQGTDGLIYSNNQNILFLYQTCLILLHLLSFSLSFLTHMYIIDLY